MNISNVNQLGFNDVLLKPKKGIVPSRNSVDTSTRFLTEKNQYGAYYKLSIPLMSAPMETVTGPEMAQALEKMGGMGILHRFQSIEDQAKDSETLKGNAGIAFGATDAVARIEACRAYVIVMDIAHAHSIEGLRLAYTIKSIFADSKFLIAGSVATAEGAAELINAGADGLRVGIGSGYACTTRLQTGHGVPQLGAIMECAAVAKKNNKAIIADGGIRSSGDIVKALAAGADCVMLGSLLAGADEAPHGTEYFGQASERSQASTGKYIEGDLKEVPSTGSAIDTINRLMEGVRSGISYSGGSDIASLQENAEFILVNR